MLLGGLAVYVLGTCVYWQLRWRAWLKDVPGPAPTTWLYGNIHAFLTHNVLPVCRTWTKRYGGAVKFWGLMGEPRLLLTDPVAVDYVLRQRAQYYPKLHLTNRAIAGVMGHGLLSSAGDDHRRQRRALQPGFSAQAIKRLGPVFERHARALVLQLDRLCGSEAALIDMYALLSAGTLDALGEGALGVNFRALEHTRTQSAGNVYSAHPLTVALDRAMKSISEPKQYAVLLDTVTMYFPVLEHLPVGLNAPSFRRNAKVLFDVAGAIVQEAQHRAQAPHGPSERESDPDVLAMLLRAHANANRSQKDSVLDAAVLSDDELRAQVSTLIFAGHETTATQLSWLLHFLARDEARQAKLYRAIQQKRQLLGLTPRVMSSDAHERALTLEELESIPYLDWCVRECLRLQCAIHTTSRVASRQDAIPLWDGRRIVVDRDVKILIPLASSVSSDENMWGAHPMSFHPERWQENRVTPLLGKPAHGGLSFLMGPRSCIGSAFGTCACSRQPWPRSKYF